MRPEISMMEVQPLNRRRAVAQAEFEPTWSAPVAHELTLKNLGSKNGIADLDKAPHPNGRQARAARDGGRWRSALFFCVGVDVAEAERRPLKRSPTGKPAWCRG